MGRKSLLIIRLVTLYVALAAALAVGPVSGTLGRARGAQSDAAGARGVRIQPSAELDTGLYRQSYALIVGESNYREWPHLFGAERDTREVEDVLKKQGFTVKVLLDTTREQFDNAIKEFERRNDRSSPSRFLFYFIGHGYTQNNKVGGEMGYIVP